ncbi:MAG: hypothetical protein WCJ33_05505 [Pseudomonadota bacterium]
MGVFYFKIFQLKQANPKEYAKIEIRLKKINNKHSPFGFSEIGEADFIKNLIHLDLSKDKIGQYKAKLDTRNEIPHFNGKIEVNSEQKLEIYINEYLSHCQDVQQASKNDVIAIYKDFLQNTVEQRYSSEIQESAMEQSAKYIPESKELIELYPDAESQVKEVLIKQNYFSLKDIETCTKQDFSNLFPDNDKKILLQEYHSALGVYYEGNNTLDLMD